MASGMEAHGCSQSVSAEMPLITLGPGKDFHPDWTWVTLTLNHKFKVQLKRFLFEEMF